MKEVEFLQHGKNCKNIQRFGCMAKGSSICAANPALTKSLASITLTSS
jgi:hypothetical protein